MTNKKLANSPRSLIGRASRFEREGLQVQVLPGVVISNFLQEKLNEKSIDLFVRCMPNHCGWL